MNVNAYIKKFGNKTFEERPFSDVDALILSELPMINYEPILKANGEIRLKDIKSEQITDALFADSPDRKFNRNQLVNMIESKRYSSIIIKNIRRIFSSIEPNQFYAITIVLPSGNLFIAFRGTDITVTGWKEDFVIALKDTFLGQSQGLQYVRDVIHDNNNKFYIGGHSKGGNIAFYSALHLTKKEASRLIKAYSFDGPGFRQELEYFPAYPYIENKMVKYLTNRNLIGSMFHGYKKYKVVMSNGLLLGGHDLYYWFINPKTGNFKYAKEVSPFYRKLSKRFMAWIDSLPNEDRELASGAFFKVFKSVNTIYDIPKKAPIDLINIKKTLKEYSEEDQKKLQVILKKLVYFLVKFSDQNA